MTDAQNTPIITPVPDPEAGTRIIFLRHGQTDWNIDHRFQGGTDIPLNDTGREQVRTAIGALQQAAAEGTAVDAIVSSPLSRAVESAEIVAEGLGVPYRGAVDGFQERSFGDLEGQIATPELILASRQSNNAFNVEPKKDFLARSLAALNRVRREYEGQTVVVAAHGMLIAMVVTALVAERHPELLNEDGIYPIPANASLTEVPLQYLDDAIDRLVVQHLEPELGPEEVPEGAENTTLTLIRHGQTDWNKANLMQGITDIPLNDTGREQARTTGKKLADMGLEFTMLVSSPLSRAHETAQLVGEHFDLQVHKTYPSWWNAPTVPVRAWTFPPPNAAPPNATTRMWNPNVTCTFVRCVPCAISCVNSLKPRATRRLLLSATAALSAAPSPPQLVKNGP